jgi:hypothetical protein
MTGPELRAVTRARDTARTMPEESTTRDLEELVRAAVEAVNRRDFDAMLGYAAPDVVYDTSPSGFGIYTGIRRETSTWVV